VFAERKESAGAGEERRARSHGTGATERSLGESGSSLLALLPCPSPFPQYIHPQACVLRGRTTSSPSTRPGLEHGSVARPGWPIPSICEGERRRRALCFFPMRSSALMMRFLHAPLWTHTTQTDNSRSRPLWRTRLHAARWPCRVAVTMAVPRCPFSAVLLEKGLASPKSTTAMPPHDKSSSSLLSL
jgi:hypothetical protein